MKKPEWSLACDSSFLLSRLTIDTGVGKVRVGTEKACLHRTADSHEIVSKQAAKGSWVCISTSGGKLCGECLLCNYTAGRAKVE